MELTGSRAVPARVERVWDALFESATLKESIPGCESIESDEENAFRVTMLAKVGPVSARFAGMARLSEIDAPRAYTMRFEASGGPAGVVSGEVHVTLAAEGADATRLSYHAKAHIGGKLAQIGSRLIDGAANKVVEDFFSRFVAATTPAATTARVDTPPLGRWRRWWSAFASFVRVRRR